MVADRDRRRDGTVNPTTRSIRPELHVPTATVGPSGMAPR